MKKTVNETVKNNLCISCGICKNVCSKKAISYQRLKGMYFPIIDNNKCISCGVCLDICPGNHFIYEKDYDPVRGKIKDVFVSWSKNETIRHNSASGGTVTTIISYLLKNNYYDCAFSVNSYIYEKQLKTELMTVDKYMDVLNTANMKSKYLPVSHENAIDYILNNRNKKVVFIGTSCSIRGILNVINKFHLKRENYLMIGLFCDKVFEYNIFDYFSSDYFTNGRKLEKMHFKNKESGGWPGNMKLHFSDGTIAYIDKNERAKVKDFFIPERCNYCIDKLNVMADISLGDNYTGRNDSKLGSNSVIIRTELGEKTLDLIKNELEICLSSIENVEKGQWIEGRIKNLDYATIKENQINHKINVGLESKKISKFKKEEYKWILEKANAGVQYPQHPEILQKIFYKDKKRTKLINRKKIIRYYLSKVYHLFVRGG